MSDIWTELLTSFRNGWCLWWRIMAAPFVGIARELRLAQREFIAAGGR